MEQKAEIIYPTPWGYRVIGHDAIKLEEICRQVFQDKEIYLAPSHTSSSGTYVTIKIETIVFSEEERLGFFSTLASYPEIKVVL